MRHLRLLGIILLVGLVAGCNTFKPNFAVKDDFWSNKQQTIGVVIAKIPQPEAHRAGGQGLLDIAINSANASDLEKHLAIQDVRKIRETADKMFRFLRGKGFKVVKIEDQLDVNTLKEISLDDNAAKNIYFTNRDFTPLKQQYNVDKIVLIQLDKIGTIRNYYGFIPLGAPDGYSKVIGQIVNLDNNQLEWNHVVDQKVASTGEWDAPPNFPGLTEAMYSAFDQSQNLLFSEFAKN